MSYMEIRNLKKVYNPYGIHPKVALNGLDFEVEKGDFICIMGASGSGKTTLVNILSTIDEATHGQIFLNQKDLLLLSEKEKANLRKVFPAYVLVKMIVTEETWYIVRNTRGVTGFVGSGTDPIPLTDEEIRAMGFDESTINVDYEVNDSVKILQGAFKDYIGNVQSIDKEKHRAKVLISMFGRETPVDVDFAHIERVD